MTRGRGDCAHRAPADASRGYFAYGSNMASDRLRARVGAARPLAAARLAGFRFVVNKRSRDGSAKANLAPDPAATVWGVLWSLGPNGWSRLDGFEDGYERVPVDVVTRSGETLAALTYVSTCLAAEPVPWVWYKALLLAGAREHGLPAEWIAALEALPARADPHGELD